MQFLIFGTLPPEVHFIVSPFERTYQTLRELRLALEQDGERHHTSVAHLPPSLRVSAGSRPPTSRRRCA